MKHWWKDTDREQGGTGSLVKKPAPVLMGCSAIWKTAVNAWAGCKYSLISDLRREADDICALLRCYTACRGNLLPTFRDKISVPTSRN